MNTTTTNQSIPTDPAQAPLTGKPSLDRPWMKYYPPQIAQMHIPGCTLLGYLHENCVDETLSAIHFYGEDISWSDFFAEVDQVARSLKAIGFDINDQIPTLLQNVPEFYTILLGAEKIGASVMCRDNTLEENVEAVAKSRAKVLFTQDYLSKEALDTYLSDTNVEKVVLIPTFNRGSYDDAPSYIQHNVDSFYPENKAGGSATMTWKEFLALGESYTGTVDAPVDVNRPLFRAYTSGSTGPSKQVIHSAYTMISIIHQMNFYGVAGSIRLTWMMTCLPPALVASVVAMVLMPMASNRLLYLDPYCDPHDVDLELMRYKPNSWPIIPVFMDAVVNNGRIPDDYDMSHLYAAGVGSEAYNNTQLKQAQLFLNNHNCKVRLTTGYGCSEAGSNVSLPMTPHPMGDGNVGIPLPLTTISIFKPGTREELTYNQIGEICKHGPGNMLGYDDPEQTAKVLQTHADGTEWLHMGDIGYMNEDGVIFTMTRGESPRYQGGDLALLPMENLIADAEITGIEDEFFVNVPDEDHPGYFLPYLYVVLKDGYTVEDIKDKVKECLKPYMYPVEIISISKRPFFHYKTNRIGLTNSLIAKRHTKKFLSLKNSTLANR